MPFSRLAPGLLVASFVGACSGDDAQSSARTSSRTLSAQSWSTLADGEPGQVRLALDQAHASIRDKLGPHRIESTSRLQLTPQRPAPANPPLDSPVTAEQLIDDSVELTWSPAHLAIEQHAGDRGRSVVVTEGKLFTKFNAEPWTEHALETDVYELWLNDVWYVARDAFDFLLMGGEVQVDAADGEGWNGGLGWRVQVSPGTPAAPAPHAAPWRQSVAFDALEATLVLDAATGAWLSITAQASYAVDGATGQQKGSLTVEASVRPLDDNAAMGAPTQPVVALPTRTRYEVERKQLLEGLAAP